MVQETKATTATESKKRGRSPGYPGIPLEEALQNAVKVRKAEGKNDAPVKAILEHWGYKATSSNGMVALSAMIKFGLMSDEGSGESRKAKLTPLALRIILDERPESTERLAAIREAALTPSIHKELWEKYQGSLPSDLNLRYYLRNDRGFQDNGADDLIKEFHKTLAFARLPESDIISPKAEDKTQPEGETEMPPQPEMKVETHSEGQKSEQKTLAALGVAQTMQTIRIPLTHSPWAMIQVPYPMTASDWKELMAWFTSNAQPLTKGLVKPEGGQQVKTS